MATWHTKLNSIEVRPIGEPLREIKNQSQNRNMMVVENKNILFTPKENPSPAIVINHSPTPKMKNNRTNSDRQYFHKNSSSQHENILEKESHSQEAV